MTPETVQTCCEGAGVSRRSVLTGAMAVGALAGLGGLPGLGSTRLAFADTPSTYTGDTLVVVSLRGGFDGLSAVVPAFDPGYAALRPTIGVPSKALVPLDGRFGMHPGLAPLSPLWSSGQLAFVHAVGQTDPTRSHFEATEELERAAPGSSLRTGWLDRTLGMTGAGTPFAGAQIGSGMAGGGFIGPYPELALSSLDDFSLYAAWNDDERTRWSTALAAMQADAPAMVAGPARSALSTLDEVAAMTATPYVPAGGAAYPDAELGDGAQLIKAGAGLRVAAVDMGNWDMHVDLGRFDDTYGWMRGQLDELSRSLAAFAADLGPAFANVTVVTLSEFGRRVEENGSGGVDHGHGNAVLLMGGGVNGGKVYGRWPGLGEADLVDGDLAGTTDYRTLLAEVLEKRCGLTSGTVFPGLSSDRLGALRSR